MAHQTLFHNADTRTVPAGAVIFQEGDDGDAMFGVVDGEVELRYGDVVVEQVTAGGVFGEMALIDHSPRSLTAVATVDSTLAVINSRKFLFLVHETPMFALDVMTTLASRLRATTTLAGRQA
jgi:CRP/FNR family transcriptional regulator, cyclic AMP receptor protein